MTAQKRQFVFVLVVLMTIAVTVLVAAPVLAQPEGSCACDTSISNTAYPSYPAALCGYLPLMGKNMRLDPPGYPAP